MVNRPLRNSQKSIGTLLKHVVGICLLSGFIFWLIHSINHSQGSKNICSMNFAGNNVCRAAVTDGMLKLGRKDLPRFPEILDEHKHEPELEREHEHDEEKLQEEANQHDGAEQNGSNHNEKEQEKEKENNSHQEEANEHEDGDYEDTVDKHDQYIDNVENYDIEDKHDQYVEDHDGKNPSEDENKRDKKGVKTELGDREEVNNNGYYDDEEEARERENDVGNVTTPLRNLKGVRTG